MSGDWGISWSFWLGWNRRWLRLSWCAWLPRNLWRLGIFRLFWRWRRYAISLALEDFMYCVYYIFNSDLRLD